MIGRTGTGVSVSGGGGEGGGITPDFLTQNYVAIPYFSQLFTIHGKQTTTVDGEVTDEQDITLPPNTMPSRTETTEGGVTTVVETTITRIEALFDFNSVGGVSALGYNPGGGGGGGADMNALLDNINSSNIGDIAPTASEVGKCLVYNGNNQWAWATPGGGGGLTYGLSWSYGSVASAQGGSYDGSASKSFTIPKDTSHLTNNAGFITSAALSGYLPLTGGTMTGAIIMKGVHIYMDPADSSSNATGDIVFRYGSGQEKARIWMDDTFSTVLGPQFRIYKTDGTQLVSTRLALASQIPSLAGYATQSWVANQGYATQTWVGQQGFLTYNDITNYLKVGSDGVVEGGQYYDFHLSGSSADFATRLYASGTYQNTLTFPSESGTLATQEWINSQGYMLRTEGMRFTSYGSYIAARFVLADGTYDTTRAAKAQGSGFIEWWSDGGYFNHHMGSVSIYDGVNDDTCYLQIGGGRIYWDPSSKSFYVVQSDGSTPANIYATGGVSALGISTGGSPSVSALTVGTLTATTLNMSGDMNANGGNLDMDSGDIDNVNHLSTSSINVNGTTISRIYWTGTYLQVKIGSNTYNFKPV